MFLRLVTSDLDEESHQELGVFQGAESLRDSGLLSQDDEKFCSKSSLVWRQLKKASEVYERQTALLAPFADSNL
jgi:hypothetical protein